MRLRLVGGYRPLRLLVVGC